MNLRPCRLLLFVSLLLMAGTARAATVNAVYNSPTDIPITASSYVATGNTVNFTLNFAPATGTNLTVVNNTGLPFIQGTFDNLAQGQAVTFSIAGTSYNFVANYYGGTGNDLVLVWAGSRLFSWGWNNAGQLGINSKVDSSVPVAASMAGVLSGKTIVSTAVGVDHCLAVCSDGTLAAWGGNGFGELGNNTTTSSLVPVAVSTAGTALAGKTVIAVAAGRNHSLALCSDGTVAAWGANSGGQVGNNSTVNSLVPVAVDASGVLSGKTVVAVTAASGASLALCSDGVLAAWGQNGQLGNGSIVDSSVPVAVDLSGVLSGRTVVALAGGYFHFLVRCSDGALAAWGANGQGELGNHSTVDSRVPVAVTVTGTPLAGKTVTSFAAGAYHNLALCSDGTVAVWGYDRSGELGNNSTTGSTFPVALGTAGTPLAGKTVVAVGAGFEDSVALCSDGTLSTWGQGNVGQLGNSSTTDSHVPVAVNTAMLAPSDVFVSANTGQSAEHFLALVARAPAPLLAVQQPAGTGLTSDVGAVNFGFVPAGTGVPLMFTLLNNGTAPLAISGVNIDGAGSSDFVVTTSPASAVAVGSATTLAVTFTPGATGGLGRNAMLHLISNDPNTSSFNISLSGSAAGTLAAGFSSATDVPLTIDGPVATGSVVNLTLNYAPATGTILTVVNNTGTRFIQGTFSNLAQGQLVVLTFGGISYDFVASYYGGTGNDLVLQWANSRLVAWGLNSSGQFGNGSVVNSLTPTAAGTAGALAGKSLTAVSAGIAHSLALCSDGTVLAWGQNSFGQLGNNSTISSLVPVAVSVAGTALQGRTVIAVAAGDHHSMALCADGTVVGWGDNDAGQLGNGNAVNSLVPVALVTAGTLLEGRTVVKLSAGGFHNLALCSDGTMAVWGDNAQGQLGINSTANSLVPVGVPTAGTPLAGRTVVAVAGGYEHSLVLCSDGTMVAWGLNNDGQLGNGNKTTSLVPVAVTSTGAPLAGKSVSAVIAGGYHNVAICTDGTMAAWGDDASGQLGNSKMSTSSVPVSVTIPGTPLAGKSFAAVLAGQFHCLTLCSDGTLAVWGSNGNGQLGINSTTNISVAALVNSSSLATGETFMAVAAGQSASHNLALVAEPVFPSGLSLAATSITATTATLNGSVNPDGNATTGGFQYGTSISYGGSTAGQNVGSGITPVNISAAVTRLLPHTIYHFQTTASNAAGSGTGADQTFTTRDTSPVANLDTVNNVGGPVTINVLNNDTDADGDALSITATTQGTKGSITTDGHSVTYTPGASFSTSDVFTYIVSDGFGGTDTGIVLVNAAPVQSWRSQTFGANAGNTAIAGDNADPNNNGISNLIEYALHGDAVGSSTGSSILPQTSTDASNHLLLNFSRYSDRPDLTLTVQAADSPAGPWTDLAQSVNAAPFTVVTSGATVNETGGANAFSVTVGDIYSMTDPAHPHRFMRLQVTWP